MGLADLDALGLLDRPAKTPTPEPTSLQERVARLRREPPGPFRDVLREAVAAEVQKTLADGALASLKDDEEEDHDGA